jgi:hypothetical protein
MKPKDKPHYVNNKEFSQAVVNYCEELREARKNSNELPVVTDYIASCFLKIAEGLSHKANFVRYTYREEMVMDAVENCLKAIDNYNVETATRTGNPNAFAYFTQIAWYAFLRRIEKEKKQQDLKVKFIAEAGIEHFLDNSSLDAGDDVQPFVDELRTRIDVVKTNDKAFKEYSKRERKKRTRSVDSDLTEFL